MRLPCPDHPSETISRRCRRWSDHRHVPSPPAPRGRCEALAIQGQFKFEFPPRPRPNGYHFCDRHTSRRTKNVKSRESAASMRRLASKKEDLQAALGWADKDLSRKRINRVARRRITPLPRPRGRGDSVTAIHIPYRKHCVSAKTTQLLSRQP